MTDEERKLWREAHEMRHKVFLAAFEKVGRGAEYARLNGLPYPPPSNDFTAVAAKTDSNTTEGAE